MPGVPDVVLLDDKGLFHFVELKSSSGNAVDLSPHQVAWLSNHAHGSTWVLVRKSKTDKTPERVYLYKGADAVDLKMDGLKTKPIYFAEGVAEWEQILNLISPI